jgi:predicted amidophosphoribosyltransferase
VCVGARAPSITRACWWCGQEAEEEDVFGTAHCGSPLCDPSRGRRLGRLHVATLKYQWPSIMISQLKKKDGAGRWAHYLPVLGRVAAGYMRSHLREMSEYTLIVPAPSHPDTVAERGYDITAHIHRTCAELVGPALPAPGVFDDLDPPIWDQVTRVAARGKGWKARRDAVSGAYQIRDDYRDYVEGKRVLVIDDVYTTGLNLEEMANELLRVGAASVDGLAVIRTIHDPGTDAEGP